MQHRTPQSRFPIAPRPPVIQPLESRRLMSVAAPLMPPMPMPWMADVDMSAGPAHPAFEVRADQGDITPRAVTNTDDNALTAAAANTTVSQATTVTAAIASPAAPVASDLLTETSGAPVVTPPDVAAMGAWDKSTVVTTDDLSFAVTPTGGSSVVSTTDGKLLPMTAIASVDQTPFTADTTVPIVSPNVGTATMVAEVTTPAPAMATVETPDVSILASAATSVAPSFGATVIESAQAAHPLALALAAGAATALWISTESARDRRREALCRTVADAAADRRLVALGLFRG